MLCHGTWKGYWFLRGPHVAHWPFVCIVAGLFMAFQENNKALKYVQYIPALSVRLEGVLVSEIVTRCEENFIFNTPSLEKEWFRQGFKDCWILSVLFVCTGNLISA